MKYEFGDIIENSYASHNNPYRIGTFVKYTNKGIQLTDTKGNFWETPNENDGLTKVGNEYHFENEKLHNENEKLKEMEGFLKNGYEKHCKTICKLQHQRDKLVEMLKNTLKEFRPALGFIASIEQPVPDSTINTINRAEALLKEMEGK